MSSKGSVLIVDDEAEVRGLASRAMLASGFDCDQAADGEEALQRATSKRYDAVVTDLRMPMRHGHALCNDLLKLPTPPQVLVLTGLTDARLARDLMSRGVRDVVQKPVAYDVLAMKVANLIGVEAKPAEPAAPASKAAGKLGLVARVESALVELTELIDDRLDDVFVDTYDLPEPPKAVRECIRRLAENDAQNCDEDGGDPEIRRHRRVTCYTTVTAVPVDRQWKRVCQPFRLALRDMSESGLRLLHTRATNADYLALCWNATRLPGVQIRVVAKVIRVTPCSPFYDIGGQFVLAD